MLFRCFLVVLLCAAAFSAPKPGVSAGSSGSAGASGGGTSANANAGGSGAVDTSPVTGAVAGATDTAGDVVSGAQGQVGAATGAVSDAANAAQAQGAAAVGGATGAVGDAVSGAQSQGAAAVGGATGAVGDAVSGAQTQGAAAVAGATGAVGSAVSGAQGQGGSAAGAVPGAVNGVVAGVTGAIDSTLSKQDVVASLIANLQSNGFNVEAALLASIPLASLPDLQNGFTLLAIPDSILQPIVASLQSNVPNTLALVKSLILKDIQFKLNLLSAAGQIVQGAVSTVQNLLGQLLTPHAYPGGACVLNGGTINKPDIPTLNGIIQGLSNWIQPVTGTLPQLLNAVGGLVSTLVNTVKTLLPALFGQLNNAQLAQTFVQPTLAQVASWLNPLNLPNLLTNVKSHILSGQQTVEDLYNQIQAAGGVVSQGGATYSIQPGSTVITVNKDGQTYTISRGTAGAVTNGVQNIIPA